MNAAPLDLLGETAPRGAAAGRQLPPGTRVAGRYVVAQVLGRGGGGAVYAAVDTRFGRAVALKVAALDDPESVERFQREARLGNRLGQASPGLVRCHDWGEVAPGRLFLVMDLVDGARPLELTRGPLAARLELLERAALLVAELHDLGIVHRDVKPSNFLVDRDERVFLSDLGLAKDLRAAGGAEELLTRAGDALGTPAFMAPEQFEGAAQADERADVYALGVMLFIALTGRPPFLGDPMRVIAAQVRVAQGVAPPPRPAALVPDLPPALDALCARALSFDPAARVPGARLFALELRRAAGAADAAEADDDEPPAVEEPVFRDELTPGEDAAPDAPDPGDDLQALLEDELDDDDDDDGALLAEAVPTDDEAATRRVTPERRRPTPPPSPTPRRLRAIHPRDGAARELELVRPLASGGRGEAWLARVLGEEGEAVVKVPLPHARGALDLEVEARILEQLDHPNIIRFFGRAGPGVLCLERAYTNPLFLLNGPDARPRLFKDPGTCWYPLPPGTALDLAHDLLAALEHLHALGFVHNDVKVGNFLVAVDGPPPADDGGVLLAAAEGRARGVLIDLGGARAVGWLQELPERQGELDVVPTQLTPLYAPPEALLGDGAECSPAVDVYAAGLVLYAMATGRLPYDHLPAIDGAKHDLRRMLELKTAERMGEVSPVSRAAVEAIPLHDVRLAAGDPRAARARFTADLWGLLVRLVDPDPAVRLGAAQARAVLRRLFCFDAHPRRPGQGAVSMNPLSNRLVDAARAHGPMTRITVTGAPERGRGARRGGRVA
ncbi:MAG: protein kinase [Planctomycetes bacterium]|nr:protein kinase [Planctomycetota bacterium]